MKNLKKIALIIAGILFTILFIGLIWWNGYEPPLIIDNIKVESPLIKANIPCPAGSPLRSLLIGSAEESILKNTTSSWKRSLIKLGLKLAFPRKIIALAAQPIGYDQPIYLYALDFGQGIKLLRLQEKSIQSRLLQYAPLEETQVHDFSYAQRSTPDIKPGFKTINACAWLGSGLVLCTDANYLRRIVEGYNTANPSTPTAEFRDISIVIDNQSGYLTRMIRYYEEKYQFEIFSTVDKIQQVSIQLQPVDKDRITGTLSFDSKTPSDTLLNDVDFFSGVLRRTLRPRGIEMNGTTRKQGDAVVLDTEMTGFASVLSHIDTLTLEEK